MHSVFPPQSSLNVLTMMSMEQESGNSVLIEMQGIDEDEDRPPTAFWWSDGESTESEGDEEDSSSRIPSRMESKVTWPSGIMLVMC